MANLIKDIKTAVNLFMDMRKDRESGYEIVIKRNKVLPLIYSGSFYNTVEGCVLDKLDREIVLKAEAAFDALPDEVKHQLQFLPKSGEFKDRANLWRAALKPVMTDKQFHVAMNSIIDWYIHIAKSKKARAVSA